MWWKSPQTLFHLSPSWFELFPVAALLQTHFPLPWWDDYSMCINLHLAPRTGTLEELNSGVWDDPVVGQDNNALVGWAIIP